MKGLPVWAYEWGALLRRGVADGLRQGAHVALFILVATLLLAQPAAAPASETTVPAACDYRDAMSSTLSALGEDPADWSVRDLGTRMGGYANPDTGTAVLNSRLPCEYVADAVRHEAMHLRQGRVYGSWSAAIAAMGSSARAELVADCASMLLGSTYTPYVDGQPGPRRGECAASDLSDARLLFASPNYTERSQAAPRT